MKLRAYRALIDATQKQFAKRIRVTELSIIKYESGASIPSRGVMRRIFAETNGAVTPNDFYDLETIEPRRLHGSNMTPKAPTLLSIGLMSGTSMDGIDVALLSTDGESVVRDVASTSLAYQPDFKILLKAAERAVFLAEGDLTRAEREYPQAVRSYLESLRGTIGEALDLEVRRLESVIHGTQRPLLFQDVVDHSTKLHAEAIQQLLDASGHDKREIDLIGYHGQTLFHRPSQRITIQAGNPQLLADLTSIPVVFDFRTNDVRSGGQGAPFAPLFHAAVAKQMGLAPLIVANCGGIANITVITDRDEELFAFDTGPGNGLIDRFVFKRTGRSCDEDGVFGSAGQVSHSVLNALMARAVRLSDGRNFLELAPPKSLDINDLHLIPELDQLSLQDGCATLEAFTVACLTASLDFVTNRGITPPHLWVVAGGGWKNPVIFEGLREALVSKFGSAVRVEHADRVRWNGTALEAQIFAYLAVRSVRGMALSVPGTTGVAAPLTGGTLILPRNDTRHASGRVRDLPNMRPGSTET